MTQKKIVISFVSVVMITLTPLPILNLLLIVSSQTDKSNFNKKYLFSTDHLESHLNYFFYTNFKISLNKNEVIVGKDKFLFLGNDIDQVIDKTQGLYKYTNQDIDKWTSKLKKVQMWYEERGIKFVITIAPNKHSVYSEKLPAWMKQNKQTITDKIISYSKNKKINLLDLRDSMKKNKHKQLYFMTDTHWNYKGASIAYEETIKYINSVYGIKYKTAKYNFSLFPHHSGDLARLLKINTLLPKHYEHLLYIDISNESNVCHGIINKKIDLEQCTNQENPELHVARNGQYTINNTSVNDNKLLLMCDSFGTANSKLYNETFNSVWRFHYKYINGKQLSHFILQHKPNIVIYQIVERSLYNGLIVKEL